MHSERNSSFQSLRGRVNGLCGPAARGYLWTFFLIMSNGGLEQTACLMGRTVMPWQLPRPRLGPPLTFRNCPALPCPGVTLHTTETAAFCRLLEGQKGGNFTLHSLHLCSYLTFQGHLSSVAGLPLDCTTFPPWKALNHFRRQGK